MSVVKFTKGGCLLNIKKVKASTIFAFVFSLLFVMAACDSNETYTEFMLPEGIPEFVQEKDVEQINWNKKAVEFGDRGIIGNKNKSGVIGMDAPSLDKQKWMWHLWGLEEKDVTIVGFHKETETIHQIITTGWTIEAGGPNNGADAHMPSSVKIPKAGEWAFLLYTGDELFDTLVYEITD
jgi:hypothetical protein